jgi:hypothetical protein
MTQIQQEVGASFSSHRDPEMLVQDARSMSRQVQALQVPARLVTHRPSELQGPIPA